MRHLLVLANEPLLLTKVCVKEVKGVRAEGVETNR